MKKTLILFIVLSLLVATVFDAFARDIENALFRDLSECSRVIKRIAVNLQSGSIAPDDLARLKKCAETLQADRLLFAERQGSLAERAATLGGKVPDRQDNVSSVLLRNLDELLVHLDANGSMSDLETVQRLLDLLVTKRSRPLLGALPYKHTNYSPREPVSSPLVKPAYKGGDRNVYAADSAASPEAPLSKEIVELAQSLQWNPVLMYEWVKNNVETEWYWGSMKGAEETLRQKSGNDADQASLLVALLRAAKFPARYVRGTIDFFPGIERAKDLTGLDDTAKIAAFFQKAGIPYKPIISGGGISNFHLEHVWVEAFIPYANYRGAVVDDQGKIWLGMDTSIKPQGYTRTPGGGVSTATLSTLRDDYLNTVQTLSPLDYLTGKLDEQLSISQPGKSWQYLKDTAVLIPDVLKIIPDSMQFNQMAITGEYQNLPDELKHKLTFTATAGGNELFSITLETLKLSNSKIALRAEPETVEDQNTIDSFGGLDNTPAYLVRLRPVLTLDGERLIVAQDGLPVGADFTLIIDIVTPNGTERISSSQINGNLSVIGVVADKAQTPAAITEADDAETILHKEAISYIDRWNKGEDDLAQLLGQRISRPTVTIATVGGQMAVTTLLDITHDMEWKGLYLDAGYRRIETTGRNARENEFMRLSALQGSVLEHRIFEDDLQVDSVSTAKLLQLAKASGTSILTIDKTSIDAVLPTLSLDDNVKTDITNAVNQNLTVTIPQNEIVYRDWSGIGYIKENTETGESGWMLSGNVAGGMTAAIEWVNNYLKDVLSSYGTKPSKEPAVKIIKIPAVDRQTGTVGKELKQKLAVLVTDKNGRPVKNAKVTFNIVAGGGTITTAQPVMSSYKGIAAIDFTLGKLTADNPIYFKASSTDQLVSQVGLNIIGAALETGNGSLDLLDKFEAYGLPDTPVKIVKTFGDGFQSLVGTPAGSIQVKVVDKYDNSVSNVQIEFENKPAAITTQPRPPLVQLTLPGNARNITFYTPDNCTNAYPIYGECSSFGLIQRNTSSNGCFVNTILGDTINTTYTVQASAPGYPNIAPAIFSLYSKGYRASKHYIPPFLALNYLESYTSTGHTVNAVKTGKQLAAPLTAELLLITDDYTMEGPTVCTNPTSGATYDCWQIVASGKSNLTKVTTGNLTFKVTSGSGKVSATANLSTPTKPENPNNGKYQAYFTAGTTAERNKISVTGNALINIPEVLFDTNNRLSIPAGYALDKLAADKKQLLTRAVEQPINAEIMIDQKSNAVVIGDTYTTGELTVYGVDTTLRVEPGVIYVNKEGRAKRDTKFIYSILPADYQALVASINLYTRDSKGVDTWIGSQPGDAVQGTGTNTILSGSSWDVRNKYLAQVVLNNGLTIEIDGSKVPFDIAVGALVPDYNHDRTIDQNDRTRAELGDKYYFWVNDDDGNGDTEGSGIPASGSAVDPSHLKVDGTRDLVDFFPVHLDIKELFEQFDPAIHTYRLRNADGALNYVVTDLKPTESGGYLTGENKDDATGAAKGIDYVQSLANAPTTSITDTGFSSLTAPYLQLKPEVINQIKNDKGVILIEAHKKTTSPLVLEVYKGTTLVNSSLKLNLSIDGVEQMFRHKNLTQEMYFIQNPPEGYTPPVGILPIPGHPVPFEGMPDRLKVSDFSNQGHFTGFDTENDGKDFVYVHGYNMNGQEVRGAQTEIFKKLYWSGSRAKFWGITWYGYDSQAPFSLPCVGQRSPDYHVNVRHAFNAGKLLKIFAVDKGLGNATFAAHSLGNMVLSTAIQEGMPYFRYLMTNAAVAEEAYMPKTSFYEGDAGAYDVGSEWYDNTKSLMFHPRWRYPHEDVNEIGYKPFLWTSEWYKRFNAPDVRAGLTWRDYFSNVRINPGNKTFVFYAPTDEAFLPFSYVIPTVGTPAEYPPNIDNVPGLEDLHLELACFNPEKFGAYPWAMQELTKGRLINGGMKYGGWGVNQDDGYYNSCTNPVPIGSDPPPFCGFIPPGDANALAENVLKTLPLFKKNPDNAFLYSDQLVTRSMLSIAKQEELLANEIPALTFAAGHGGVTVFDSGGLKRNVNIQKKYLLDPPNAPWVRDPKYYEWKHNDLYYVAYPYLRLMYDDWVTIINSGEIK